MNSPAVNVNEEAFYFYKVKPCWRLMLPYIPIISAETCRRPNTWWQYQQLGREFPMGTTTNSGTHKDTMYSHMVGVFRERTHAEQALNELRQAGFQETELTVYDPHPAGEPVDSSHVDSGMRVLVQVLAEGREQEAVGILVSNGANNADLPLETELYHGSIIGSNDAQIATPSTAGGPFESFYGTAIAPGHPNDTSIMDNPNNPHG